MPHFESNTPSAIFYGSVFRISSYGQMCTETGAFSTHSFRTLFKNAISRSKSKLHQQTDSERFSKISVGTKKYAKNYNELLQELKNYLSPDNHSQISTSCL